MHFLNIIQLQILVHLVNNPFCDEESIYDMVKENNPNLNKYQIYKEMDKFNQIINETTFIYEEVLSMLNTRCKTKKMLLQEVYKILYDRKIPSNKYLYTIDDLWVITEHNELFKSIILSTRITK